MFRLENFFLIIYSVSVFAQITYEGPAEGSVPNGVILNTNDFSFNFQTSEPFKIVNESKPPEIYQHIDFTDSFHTKRIFYYLWSVNSGDSDSVIIFQNFQGIPQTNYNPPDDYIAAGPDHLIMVVNGAFRIYDKNGNVQNTISSSEWYSNVVSGAAPVDPKVLFDHFYNRWVMVWLYINHIQLRSYFLISVSDDENPNGNWLNWALPSNVNGNSPSNNWGDYQGVGFDNNAIYITSNQFSFSGTFNYAKLRIIDKADIYLDSNPGVVRWKDIWKITVPGSSSNASYLRPARMFGTSDSFYLFYLPNGGGNFCSVYELLNPLNHPVLTGVSFPITAFVLSPNSMQLGGSRLIEGGGSALRNEPVVKNGILHAVHSIRNPNNTLLSGLHYLAIDLNSGIVRKDIAMGDDEHFFFYPALAVDKNNNIIFSYSRSSQNEYAGGYFTLLPAQFGVPTTSIELMAGRAYFDRDNGTGRNRWGDYSGAWIDPVDSASFWICTEYVASLNTWGTWIGGVKYDNIIPVELISFVVKVDENNVIFNWETASEINNAGYIFNRGINSDSFEQIGFVEGNGTTTEKKLYSFKDNDLILEKYIYQLIQVDYNGTKNILVQLSVDINPFPSGFSLSQNYPNPFNPKTSMQYTISSRQFVTLKVYDLLGREVATLVNEEKATGEYEVEFSAIGGSASGGNAYNLPSGIYFYQLKAGEYSETKKMILLK